MKISVYLLPKQYQRENSERNTNIPLSILPCRKWFKHQLRKEDLSDVSFPKAFIKTEGLNNGRIEKKDLCQSAISYQKSKKVNDATVNEDRKCKSIYLNVNDQSLIMENNRQHSVKDKARILETDIPNFLQFLRSIVVNMFHGQTLFNRATRCNLTVNKTMNKFAEYKLDLDAKIVLKLSERKNRKKSTKIVNIFAILAKIALLYFIELFTSRTSQFGDQVSTNLLSNISSNILYSQEGIPLDEIIDNNNSNVGERGQIDGHQSPSVSCEIVPERNFSDNNSNFQLKNCTFSNRNEFPESKSHGYLIKLSGLNHLFNKNSIQHTGIRLCLKIIANYLNWPYFNHTNFCSKHSKDNKYIDWESYGKRQDSLNIVDIWKADSFPSLSKPGKINIQDENTSKMKQLMRNSVSEYNKGETLHNKDSYTLLRDEEKNDERKVETRSESFSQQNRRKTEFCDTLTKGKTNKKQPEASHSAIVFESLPVDGKIESHRGGEMSNKLIKTSEIIKNFIELSKSRCQLRNSDNRNPRNDQSEQDQSYSSSELEVNNITIDQSIISRPIRQTLSKAEMFRIGDSIERELPSLTMLSYLSKSNLSQSKVVTNKENKSIQIETMAKKADQGTQLDETYSYDYIYPTLTESNISHNTLVSIDSLVKESSACDSYLQVPDDISVEYFIPNLILSNKFVLDDMILKPIRRDVSTSTIGLNLTNKIDKAILVRIKSIDPSVSWNRCSKSEKLKEKFKKSIIDCKRTNCLQYCKSGKKKIAHINSICKKEIHRNDLFCLSKRCRISHGYCKLLATHCKIIHHCFNNKKTCGKETKLNTQYSRRNRLGGK
ncbi:unnamed protein product [Dimorphilus gyrociliatus]|uniref:Uncharacterized protein n=1 Tax=Dimorphilus gyrociliatus TaxID=2664684 RepID=A0A7I8VV41_9ANNE|nr:unnamed protein product [Dimorphilus gyrociliatus]